MFSRSECLDGHVDVEMIRGRNQHGIYILVRQKILPGDAFEPASLWSQPGKGNPRQALVDIADGNQPCAVVVEKGVSYDCAAASEAGNPQANPVVCPENACIGSGLEGNSSGCRNPHKSHDDSC